MKNFNIANVKNVFNIEAKDKSENFKVVGILVKT